MIFGVFIAKSFVVRFFLHTFAVLMCAREHFYRVTHTHKGQNYLLTFNERLYRKTYFHYGAEQNCSEREFRLECVRE